MGGGGDREGGREGERCRGERERCAVQQEIETAQLM